MALSLMTRPLRHAALLLAASTLVPVAISPEAGAQELSTGEQAGAQDPLQSGTIAAITPRRMAPVRATITLQAGSGQVIHLHEGAANVFTADPKVAEVRPAQRQQPVRLRRGARHHHGGRAHRQR